MFTVKIWHISQKKNSQPDVVVQTTNSSMQGGRSRSIGNSTLSLTTTLKTYPDYSRLYLKKIQRNKIRDKHVSPPCLIPINFLTLYYTSMKSSMRARSLCPALVTWRFVPCLVVTFLCLLSLSFQGTVACLLISLLLQIFQFLCVFPWCQGNFQAGT